MLTCIVAGQYQPVLYSNLDQYLMNGLIFSFAREYELIKNKVITKINLFWNINIKPFMRD
jgi:hypothetical protein